MQIDGGRMDKFAAYSGAGALPMGYYEGGKMKLWQWARRFTLADRFFHAAFGGSLLNHFFLICACVPRYENAPKSLVARLDAEGRLIGSRPDKVTPDGYVVNNMEPWSRPHQPIADPMKLIPPQDMRTIGDALSEKGIDWAWYAGGWNDALAGRSEALIYFHPQPFVYFRNYGKDTSARRKHLKDESDFEQAIRHGDLPPVTFYKPASEFNEHPGYAEIMAGDAHLDRLLHAIEASSIWRDAVIIVTYDENGGYWDHVPPPKIDRWGPGTRVPTLVLSPFAKKGFVDHTIYDTTSILRLIEKRFGLDPLGARDRNAGDLTHALDF
jgi:phospholipase C